MGAAIHLRPSLSGSPAETPRAVVVTMDGGDGADLPISLATVPERGAMSERLALERFPSEQGAASGRAQQESGVFASRRATAMSTPVLPDEEALIARAAGGDTESFRVLYTRHRSDVARLVYRMIGSQADLDDVVQEVFFQVFRSLKDFRGQAKLSTWIHRVTVNVVLMHRRAARSRPTYAEEQAQDVTVDEERVLPDEDAARRERVRAFSRLLDRLADKKRVVFVLHELEGMAPAEIAKAVGAPVLTVRTRLFYARREIEAMLGDEPALAGLRGAGLLGTVEKADGKDGASSARKNRAAEAADGASEVAPEPESTDEQAPAASTPTAPTSKANVSARRETRGEDRGER